MRTKTPIFECSLKPTIFLMIDGELAPRETNIISINGKKIDSTIMMPVDSYIKLLLDDFITLPRLPKTVYVSYVYIISGDNAYICYDAISVKGDNKETQTPALFIKTTGQFAFIAKLTEYLSEGETDQLLHSGHVHLNVDFEEIKLNYIAPEGKQGYKFTIHQEIKFFRYPWGEVIKVFPMPKLPEPGNAPKHGQLFGVDNDVCGEIWKSIEKLNTILRTLGNKKVFIEGEPGSGKEVFANAIHYGSVLSKPDNLVVRSVAGADTKELRKLLFGREVDGVGLPGLIEKAAGGTLFLDEFDKMNKDFYPELLRVLEAEEYVPVDGKEILKVGDVNWIFAGAFMDTDVSNARSDLPQDFWSRLTSYINIKNPIKFQPKQDAKTNGTPSKYSYAQVVFLYFFLQEAVEKGEGVNNVTTNNKGDFRSGIISTLFIDCSDGLLRPSGPLLKFANKFNENINGGKHPKTVFSLLNRNHKIDLLDSVRSIRQAAKIAFSKCYYSALKEEDPKNFWDKQVDDQNTALNEAEESVKIAREK